MKEYNNYFSSFALDNLQSDIEDYGKECYDDGYEDGLEDAKKGLGENVNDGLICREHVYNGREIRVWIEGPDFKGDRFKW